MHLTGLRDDYAHEGRVLIEILESEPPQGEIFVALARAYKAINAPLGVLGRRTLERSTHALLADDADYAAFDAQLADLSAARNAIAGRMIAILEAAEFAHTPINVGEAQGLIGEADALVRSVE